MELFVKREWLTNTTTIGKLYVDGRFECYTLEDCIRPAGVKVPGETAIPEGRFRVIVNKSERFSKKAGHDVFMPLLLDVPNFNGVRLHVGNYARDTEGCILVGTERSEDMIAGSRKAYAALLLKIEEAIKRGEEVWITVSHREMERPAAA